MRPSDYPKPLRVKLIGLIDMALPDCYWQRRFQRHWQDLGIDAAWAKWKAEAPIINEFAIPLIESTIEELKQSFFH